MKKHGRLLCKFVDFLSHWKDISTNVCPGLALLLIIMHNLFLFLLSFSYNMIGHCKFGLTLLGGVLLFQDPLSSNQFLGVLFTFIGILLYTHFKLKEQAKKKEEELRKGMVNRV